MKKQSCRCALCETTAPIGRIDPDLGPVCMTCATHVIAAERVMAHPDTISGSRSTSHWTAAADDLGGEGE